MKTVNIYIETTIKSPIVKDGKYASALVFTRSNGEEAYRVMSGKECESTYNRLTLIAIIKSLQKLKEQCHVVIHTDNAYIKNISHEEVLHLTDQISADQKYFRTRSAGEVAAIRVEKSHRRGSPK